MKLALLLAALALLGWSAPGISGFNLRATPIAGRLHNLTATGGAAAGMTPAAEIFEIEVEGFIDEMDTDAGKAASTMNRLVQLFRNLDGPTLDSMSTSLTKLVYNLTVKVNNSHAADVDELYNRTKAFAVCRGYNYTDDFTVHADETLALKNQYIGAKKIQDKSQEDRDMAKVIVDACVPAVTALKDTRNKECRALLDFQVVRPKELEGSCDIDESGSETTWEWVKRMKKYIEEQQDEAKMRHVACDEAATAVVVPEAECVSNITDLYAKEKVLSEDESDTIDATCGWFVGQKGRCATYHACYQRELQAYNEFQSAMQNRSAQRQLQWQMLMRLGCLFSAFNTTAGTVNEIQLNDCANTTSYPDKHLLIPDDAAPTATECDGSLHVAVYPERPVVALDTSMCKAEADDAPYQENSNYTSTQCAENPGTQPGMCKFGYTQKNTSVLCLVTTDDSTVEGKRAACEWVGEDNLDYYSSGVCTPDDDNNKKAQCYDGSVKGSTPCASPEGYVMARCGKAAS